MPDRFEDEGDTREDIDDLQLRLSHNVTAVAVDPRVRTPCRGGCGALSGCIGDAASSPRHAPPRCPTTLSPRSWTQLTPSLRPRCPSGGCRRWTWQNSGPTCRGSPRCGPRARQARTKLTSPSRRPPGLCSLRFQPRERQPRGVGGRRARRVCERVGPRQGHPQQRGGRALERSGRYSAGDVLRRGLRGGGAGIRRGALGASPPLSFPSASPSPVARRPGILSPRLLAGVAGHVPYRDEPGHAHGAGREGAFGPAPVFASHALTLLVPPCPPLACVPARS